MNKATQVHDHPPFWVTSKMNKQFLKTVEGNISGVHCKIRFQVSGRT